MNGSVGANQINLIECNDTSEQISPQIGLLDQVINFWPILSFISRIDKFVNISQLHKWNI